MCYENGERQTKLCDLAKDIASGPSARHMEKFAKNASLVGIEARRAETALTRFGGALKNGSLSAGCT
jgi:hypothetical protein